jgi:Ca-activated chloride channel family protein
MVGSGAETIPEKRYGSNESAAEKKPGKTDEIAFVRLRYKQPGESKSSEVSHPVLLSMQLSEIEQASDNLQFASAVAGFGQLLRGGKYTGDWGYEEALKIARGARGYDPHGYRSEFVSIMELAQTLSSEVLSITFSEPSVGQVTN